MQQQATKTEPGVERYIDDAPRLVPVPHFKLPVIWDDVTPLLAEIADAWAGKFDETDIFAMLASREWQMWLGVRGDDDIISVCITRIISYPLCRTVEIVGLVAHDFDAVEDLLTPIEDWGRTMGCSEVEGVGRYGWKRRLKGWKARAYMSKEL